jgi:hypothetical protein
MYNTKIICTYHSSDVFLETDQLNETGKNFVRDTIYRQELLNILNMEEFNEKEMDIVIHDLYTQVKNCQGLKECMQKLAGHFSSIDEEFGLMLLFAFDYMYLTHICICEFLENGKISDENIRNLRSIVF